MINYFELIGLLIASICIFLSQLIDFYSYHIKSAYLLEEKSDYLSVVNWFQYIGRIFAMVSVFSLSFMIESGIFALKLEIMFICTIFLAGFYALLCIFWRQLAVIPYLVQRIGCLNIFGEYGYKFYWFRAERFKFGKLFYLSTLVNVILILAMITPIFAQKANPSFRMTFAYAGQALNFLATIIVFVYIDRILYSSIFYKGESSKSKISKIIYGKVAALFIAPLIIILFIV